MLQAIRSTHGSALFEPQAIDSAVFLALTKLNAISARSETLQAIYEGASVEDITFMLGGTRLGSGQLKRLRPNQLLADVLNRALELRRDKRTLGTRDFLLALAEAAVNKADDYDQRPLLVDLMVAAAGGRFTDNASAVAGTTSMLALLQDAAVSSEDFEYFIAFERERIVFRAYSTLDDVVQRTTRDVLLPQRALLTHFKDRYGGFTEAEIGALEDLVNSRHAKEADFQRFFETNPHFLRRWDIREIYPHVYLSHGDSLIPDFILADRELQRALILELKLPRPQLVVRQTNRERFSACVLEARAQLLRYRDWFRDRQNRLRLRELTGMEIYEPHLAVLIGRSSEFVDDFDRQRLRSDYPDIDVSTYDDLVTYARRRRLIVG